MKKQKQTLFHSTWLAVFIPMLASSGAVAAESTVPQAAEATLPEVQVEANAEQETALTPIKDYVARRGTSGSKTDTPILETPQSISVITRDELDARNVQTLTDAVAYTPGVQVGGFGYDPRFDSFAIRGFDATYTGIYRDGLRQLSSNFSIYKEEAYSAERIDVLKGPASVLYGQSEPGGLVNITSKRPSFDTRREVQIQAGNNDRKQGQFDVTGALDDDNTLAYRLTGLVRDADSQYKFGKDNRVFIAPALTWKPNDRTSLTILGQVQTDKTVGNTSYANDGHKVLTGLPSGDPRFQNFTQEQYQLGYLFEHKLNDAWTLRQNLRAGRLDADARYTEIDALDFANGIANRSTGRLVERLRTYALDNQAEWHGNTGPLAHTVLFGVDWVRSMNNGRMGFGAAPDLDLASLNYGEQAIDSPILDTTYRLRLNQTALYTQDQIKLDRWILTLGGRYDWSETRQSQVDPIYGTDNQDSSDNKFSGRIGLGYLFDNGISPYVSYSTSFVPVVGKDVNGGFFKPTTGKQVEAGVKFQPDNINAMMTASIFQITQENLVLSAGPLAQTQAGEVRSRGLELETKASLADGLSVTTAYTYLLPKFAGSADENDGHTLAGIPKHTISLWGDYTLPSGVLKGVGLGAGVRYLSSSWANNENRFRNDGVAFFDMAAHYDVSNHWRLAVNANNLTDKEQTICNDGYCYLGAKRTVIGSLRYVW